jgi:hypothetical protein
MQYLNHSALLNNELGLFSIVGFPWLHHITSLADGTMETMVCTSKVYAIPVQFSLVFNAFLKLIFGPYAYEEM